MSVNQELEYLDRNKPTRKSRWHNIELRDFDFEQQVLVLINNRGDSLALTLTDEQSHQLKNILAIEHYKQKYGTEYCYHISGFFVTNWHDLPVKIEVQIVAQLAELLRTSSKLTNLNKIYSLEVSDHLHNLILAFGLMQ